MGCEPRPLSSIGPRRGATSRARAGCKFVLSTLLATIALFTASTVSTHAQTNWTGAVSNGWFNAGNWNAGVPTAATSANIDTVTPNSTEVRGAGATALNLTVGQNGIGMLAIPNGGTLTDFGGFVGNLPGSQGTVTVSGAGSTWTNTGNRRGRRPGHGHAYHPRGRHGEQCWRRLRRIGCRLDWYGDGDRPGLQLEQQSRRRAQYRQFWHGHTHDRERWHGHQ